MPYIKLHEHKEGISMIETNCKKSAVTTKHEIEKAIQSCTVQRRIGHPPDERFKEIVSLSENGLRNCPVEVADSSNSSVIFGPNRPIIRGTTTRYMEELRTKEQRFGIPRDFYKLHKMFTIMADVMFGSGITFLVTFSRKIKFQTAEFISKRTAILIAKSL